jgi:hypothetical protein
MEFAKKEMFPILLNWRIKNMNSKRLDSKGLRLGIMLMGEKFLIICSILLTIIFSVTPIQASATSAFGIVRVAPPLSICMQGETHYLEDPCDGSLVTRLLSDTIMKVGTLPLF